MISAIQSFVTSPALYNMTQSTVTQITTETCLKAVGRPAFILGDKDIDSQTKKFSSTKEFLYQMTCLGIYLAAVMPILRKGTFALARKMYKDEPVFKIFKNSGDFMKYYKMNDTEKAAKLEEINKTLKTEKITKDKINEDFAKGLTELTSIVGSVTGLAVVAPVISHPLIHPILRTMGLDENKKDDKKPEQQAQQTQTPEAGSKIKTVA